MREEVAKRFGRGTAIVAAVALTAAFTSHAPGEDVIDALGLAPPDSMYERRLAPLGEADIERYQAIFQLQEEGLLDEADRHIEQLDDTLLLGHVLAQRYLHPTAHRSSFEELEAWLRVYADHPQADRIHRLAVSRQPNGAEPPAAPVPGFLNGAGQEIRAERLPALAELPERDEEATAALRAWKGRILELIAEDEIKAALTELRRGEGREHASQVERDLVAWSAARRLLAAGADHDALHVARQAALRSGEVAPGIHWAAGLAAWREGDPELALEHFAAEAGAQAAPVWERARAAFWAARAHETLGRPYRAVRYLRLAASEGDSFYAQLARARLGVVPAMRFEAETRGREAVEMLLRFGGARRAMALGQVGLLDEAEREIRKLAARSRPRLLSALMVLAEHLDLPAAQLRLGVHLVVNGGEHHPGLYPLPSWEPERGFTLDRALLFAFMRAESGFDPAAESAVGAHGLMQLMPATAEEVAARIDLDLPGPKALFEPDTNIRLGEAYLLRLLNTDTVAGDLVMLAAAYNAGLSRVARWKQERPNGDPILFIESLPMAETRGHVRKVMANLWTYRARLGQEAPSLAALAAGRWPHYVALDSRWMLAGSAGEPYARN